MCRFVKLLLLVVASACIAAMLAALWPRWLGESHACDPADTKAVCTGLQECFNSHSAVVCRDAERIAIQISKPDPALYNNGAAKALTY
jgi:hypothetical protein